MDINTDKKWSKKYGVGDLCFFQMKGNTSHFLKRIGHIKGNLKMEPDLITKEQKNKNIINFLSTVCHYLKEFQKNFIFIGKDYIQYHT